MKTVKKGYDAMIANKPAASFDSTATKWICTRGFRTFHLRGMLAFVLSLFCFSLSERASWSQENDPDPTPNVEAYAPIRWVPGPAIAGGMLTAPVANLTVEPGTVLECNVTQATDRDEWDRRYDDNTLVAAGDEADSVHYQWIATGGSYTNPNAANTTWTAPTMLGTYTLSCIVDDTPTAVVLPQLGTRDDPALDDVSLPTRSVQVVVSESSTYPPQILWQAGTPISCGGIRWPQQNAPIVAGTEGQVSAFLATDNDIRAISINNVITSQKSLSDPCVYTWTASGGTFKNNVNKGQQVVWIAPSVPGQYLLQLKVDDQHVANQPGFEVGSRGDIALGLDETALEFTVAVDVVAAP